MTIMNPKRLRNIGVWFISLLAVVGTPAILATRAGKTVEPQQVEAPALSVSASSATHEWWPVEVSAYGDITAWQEAIIGAEVGGMQIDDVLVEVGDEVKAGQVLARFVADSVEASLEEQRASLEVAEALHSETVANAERARALAQRNALSDQEIRQYLIAEKTAGARVKVEKAKLQSALIRRKKTRVIAPYDGVISARTATAGSLAQQGAELFRIIRSGKIEWQAEVSPRDVQLLHVGQKVVLRLTDEASVEGKVRAVAPIMDPSTRTGIVYVSLPKTAALRPGMFAEGAFQVGSSEGVTLPQAAVVYRDGFSFVFRIGPDNKVIQTPVDLGRRRGGRVEIVGDISSGDTFVALGAGFLADGDVVDPVEGMPMPLASAAVPSSRPEKR